VTTAVEEAHVRNRASVHVTDTELRVTLADGRGIGVPLEWYPRLLHATHSESRNVRLIGKGTGIHWPDLDEDISVAGLIEGRRSTESKASLRKWLSARESVTVQDEKHALTVAEKVIGEVPASSTVNRHTMKAWVVEALEKLGGSASFLDICKVVWDAHRKEIEQAGDAFFDWNFEIRWSVVLLRKEKVLKPAEKQNRGIWTLAGD
jgi:hypothetical protein